MTKQAFVYVMANKRNGTLYVGAATNLVKRVWEHRQGLGSAFMRKYKLFKLVYVETHGTIDDAFTRERLIKKWKRQWKIRLIEQQNPCWQDLFEEICQ